MSEEPFSRDPFEPRKAYWTTIFMGWLFCGPAICLFAPTIVVFFVVAVSDVLSVLDIVCIIIGASSIAMVVSYLNQRDDPLQGQRHSDLDAP